MKRTIWNPETKSNETVSLTEDRSAWVTAAAIFGFIAVAAGGVLFILFG